ncbi:GNAT family N-acetyltransferase [Halosegnis marinus]|uniref:GNAT family N-acetyltransferase n=1 Tax=Halosegnis marinus TaxID=3034023 RepID=A0ABD5ZL74_9EURY|nr:GNAT family N-acetyltransferase [Halosegnis sp. DT85]
MKVRPATHDDYDAVAAFTENTWPDRDGGDYIPRIYHDWIENDDAETFVLDDGEDLAGIAQGVMLSPHEGWAQGMRVNPDYRGEGVSPLLSEAIFDWCREHGATVCRNMVFSWNGAGLGQSRATGFDPAAEFRWMLPDPDPTAEAGLDVRNDPDAAWSCFHRSDANAALRGLTLDLDESYAVAELTRERLHRAAAEQRVFAVGDGDGTRAMSYRTRTGERDEETYAEYGVAAWADTEALRSLVAALRRDAADLGADATRVYIPETARHVSDAAYVRAGIYDDPDFLLEADLTGR